MNETNYAALDQITAAIAARYGVPWSADRIPAKRGLTETVVEDAAMTVSRQVDLLAVVFATGERLHIRRKQSDYVIAAIMTDGPLNAWLLDWLAALDAETDGALADCLDRYGGHQERHLSKQLTDIRAAGTRPTG